MSPVLIFLIAVIALAVLMTITLYYLPPPRPKKKIKPATHLRVKFIHHIP